MTTGTMFSGQIHPSVFHNIAGPMRAAEATLRPHGALRYRCPVNDGFVLLTDDATLEALNRPRARLRCNACGEMHLLMQDATVSDLRIPA